MVKKTFAAIFTVLVLSSALTACNTTRGVGQDISEGGSAISGAATKSAAVIPASTRYGQCRTVNSGCLARCLVLRGAKGTV